MANASDYLEEEILDHVLRNLAFTSPTTVYVGLFLSPVSEAATDADLEAGTLTNEVSGGAYARQSAAFDAITTPGGVTQNTADIDYPQATADWGTVTHFAILDAVTTGNVLIWGRLTDSKTVDEDDTFKIAAGDLTVTLA